MNITESAIFEGTYNDLQNLLYELYTESIAWTVIVVGCGKEPLTSRFWITTSLSVRMVH